MGSRGRGTVAAGWEGVKRAGFEGFAGNRSQLPQ